MVLRMLAMSLVGVVGENFVLADRQTLAPW